MINNNQNKNDMIETPSNKVESVAFTEAMKAYETILEAIGENPSREGLADTPKRHIKFLMEFCNPKPFKFTTFDKEDTDEIVVQLNIPYFSLCEHHFLPFYGFAHIGYLPNKRIVGLSKLARTVDFISHAPQNQERITSQVAEFLMEKLDAKGVGVILSGEHMCMSMRGISKPGAVTYTSKMLGLFKEDMQMQKQFMERIQLNNK